MCEAVSMCTPDCVAGVVAETIAGGGTVPLANDHLPTVDQAGPRAGCFGL